MSFLHRRHGISASLKYLEDRDEIEISRLHEREGNRREGEREREESKPSVFVCSVLNNQGQIPLIPTRFISIFFSTVSALSLHLFFALFCFTSIPRDLLLGLEWVETERIIWCINRFEFKLDSFRVDYYKIWLLIIIKRF